jgi:uncharacterized protein with NRDE domain/quercetin dioxygenase-like cupin family protein
MTAASLSPIHLNALEMRFLVDDEDSNGRATVFETRVPASAMVPPPHSHDGFEETVYGLEGVFKFTVDGTVHEIGPGQALRIERGQVHSFDVLNERSRRKIPVGRHARHLPSRLLPGAGRGTRVGVERTSGPRRDLRGHAPPRPDPRPDGPHLVGREGGRPTAVSAPCVCPALDEPLGAARLIIDSRTSRWSPPPRRRRTVRSLPHPGRVGIGPLRATTIVPNVCLLVVAWQHVDGWPLVVGANRDEWFDRPATAITVLQDRHPMILGGRDERAGGTWMAINEHGVVCGLTNTPMPDGPDPTKLSRGRLPLIAARARTAVDAAHALDDEANANPYNPAWLLVGDRESLHYLAVGPEQSVEPQRLDPGLHVLENAAFGVRSVKVDYVRSALQDAEAGGHLLWDALPGVLGDHTIPDAPSGVHRFPDGRERLEATLAPCVHADGYGTRSSTLVRVGDVTADLPEILIADGPPCTSPFVDARHLWPPAAGS